MHSERNTLIVYTITLFFAIIFSSISFQILHVHRKPAKGFKFQVYHLPRGSETKVSLCSNAITGQPFPHKLSLKGPQSSFSGFWNRLDASYMELKGIKAETRAASWEQRAQGKSWRYKTPKVRKSHCGDLNNLTLLSLLRGCKFFVCLIDF